MRKFEIDILFFDFDGTLVNSIPPAIDAIQEMMDQLGYPYKTKEEIGKHVGYGETPLVAGSIGSTLAQEIEKAKNLYYQIYADKLKAIPLYPGIKDFLLFCKDKTNLVLSNKSDHFIRLILDNHGISYLFKEIIGGDKSTSLKPDPAQVLELLHKYQVNKNRALFVGDMVIDVETGKNAGIHTCAVTYGFESVAKLKASLPEILVNNITELKTYIT